MLRTMLTSGMPSLMQILFVQHLAEIGGGRSMHQRLVPLAPHGLGHAERRERIDEAGGAFGRRGARRQRQALAHFQRAVLRVHRSADHRDGLAHQCFRGIGRAGLDDDARAFVTNRHGFVEPAGHRPHRALRHLRGDDGSVLGAGRFRRAHIGRADEEAEVGRVDRRRLDADDDLVRRGLGSRHVDERDFQFTALLDQRTQLQSGLAVAHVDPPLS
ncbi:hypothetical protein ACVJ5M_004721 [Bradyrhizobium sp. S3.7.6]